MVTIVDFMKRESAEGKEYGVLVLQGEIQTVRSQKTNRPYITARKTSVPTTLNEEFAKNLVGQTLPGRIEKQDCEEYTFVNPETGQKMKLSHTYVYNDDPVNMEEQVLA